MSLALEAEYSPPFVTRDHVAEKLAFEQAAKGRAERAALYEQWAEEAFACGDSEKYEHWLAEAHSSREAADRALSFAELEAHYAETSNA